MSGALGRVVEHSTSDHWDTGLKPGVSGPSLSGHSQQRPPSLVWP